MMFAVTYIPQVAILTLFNGPLAVFTTVLLVLSESSTIFSVLSKNFLIEDAIIDTHDATLLCRNQNALVANERQVKSGRDPVGKLGKLVSTPFAKFTPKAIIRYFMYLPLNFIPVFGTILFVILQGRKFGPTAHARYFQLKQMKKQEKERFVEQRKAAYTRLAHCNYPQSSTTNKPLASVFPPSCSSSSLSLASSFASRILSVPPSGPQIWKRAYTPVRAGREAPLPPSCANRPKSQGSASCEKLAACDENSKSQCRANGRGQGRSDRIRGTGLTAITSILGDLHRLEGIVWDGRNTTRSFLARVCACGSVTLRALMRALKSSAKWSSYDV